MAMDEMPQKLPIFRSKGTLLLPRGRVVLPVFEPHYLKLMDAALGDGRMVGVVRPFGEKFNDDAPFYKIGCVGRIIRFEEMNSQKYLITLKGVLRFQGGDVSKDAQGVSWIIPQWMSYRHDLEESPPFDLSPEIISDIIIPYTQKFEIQENLELFIDVQKGRGEAIVNILSALVPLESPEKQMLLEAHNPHERAKILFALMKMQMLAG